MASIWDYDVAKIKKSKQGKNLILERMINFGLKKGEKIPLKKVKANWSKLNLLKPQKRLLKLLIKG